ncbi:hypothetical protein A2Z22_03395 [Candidatus Woesebacteria bacterium RBG_16_34_12]|uniref:CBS domain-containing protein n=1 Tax=Candidatus Woesebacteria bacterium RBG_16_34_12 TaxID=1802480 RepID=A0A1F7XBH0_9BACT|nr:MAG: hypothetical protein A2Z22_03395 [Candidatus Woesebacteria bacterium RBG_16_34_12]
MLKLGNNLQDKEFWYKDIILVCDKLPDFERDEVNLTTFLSKNTILKTPLISSPMDTVTESKMAILLALMGGIGVIHYNFKTIEEQIAEAEKVKRFEAGFVLKPLVLGPNSQVTDVLEIAKKHGFYSTPITQDGTLKTKLIGIVTRRDIRYLETEKELNTPLKKLMTPFSKLVTAPRELTLDKADIRVANKIIRKNNLDTLPIIDKSNRLVALVTDSDLRKDKTYPLATKDKNKCLKVLIAVESRLNLAKERIKQAVEVGVDGIVVDASVVFKQQIEIAKFTKKNYPQMDVVLGNVDSGKMVSEIIKSGGKWVDALRVGIGPGAACITQEILGVGRAQASAVSDCSQTKDKLTKNHQHKISLIADGGIKKPSDITKALALGADSVMAGSLFAGLEEAPGEAEFDESLGYLVKKYRGMGSMEAMEMRGSYRYAIEGAQIKIPEGKVYKVGYKGSGFTYIPRLIAAIKQSMQKLGCKDIKSLQKNVSIKPIIFN